MRGLFREPIAPVVRVPAVVLEGENAKIVGKGPVVDRVRKARHELMPDIRLGLGVVDQAHPMAGRAACMTSS